MSDPRAATAYPFDAQPLVEPVDPAAARAFVQQLRQSGRIPSTFTGSTVVVIVVMVVFAVIFGAVLLTMAGAVVTTLVAAGQGEGLVGVLFALVPFLVIGAIMTVFVVMFLAGNRSGAQRMFRLDRFARANGMSYAPKLDGPGLPGMIFGLGSARQASDLVRGEHPRFVEFANYQYTTGSGKNQTTHRWGYVAVRLDVPLPHIVLDAQSNNGLFGSNLPTAFQKDQRLSLEGDFDRYFSLYCPPGYERDALYLFTPDIMARFIDNAAALDVEIVDDWLFLYAKRDFSTLDPATWAWLFSVVGALLDKLAQWARWRDDRLRTHGAAMTDAASHAGAPGAAAAASAVPFVPPLDALRPPPGVAQPGRRLQRRVPWAPIVVGGIFVVVWILMQTGLVDLFFRG